MVSRYNSEMDVEQFKFVVSRIKEFMYSTNESRRDCAVE